MSIRKDLDKGYTFPPKMPLQKRLKDVLEDTVDEKYYLSDKTIESFLEHNERHFEKNTGFVFALWSKDDIANTIRANGALSATDNTIIEPCLYSQGNQEIEKINEIACTKCASDWKGMRNQAQNAVVEIDNVNLLFNIYGRDKGSSFAGNAYDSDGVSPTLNTSQGGNREPMIVETDDCERYVKQALKTLANNDCSIGDTINPYNQTVDKSGICPTITTRPEGFKTAILPVVEPLNTMDDGTCRTLKAQHNQSTLSNFMRNDSFGATGVIVYDDYNNQFRADQDTIGSITTKIGDKGLRTGTKLIDAKSFRIRKLTPKECWRLMGFDDSDIDVCIENGLSNSQLYKMAGNSIVVNVLEALLDNLYNPKPALQMRLFV